MHTQNNKSWIEDRIKQDEIDKYLENGEDFIREDEIEGLVSSQKQPDAQLIRDILDKSLSIETLLPEETAALMRVKDPELIAQMQETAFKVKKKVYDNRIVTFAPLYLSNYCVNNCLYCGFRTDNDCSTRRCLSIDEVRRETEVLAGDIGHKRLIVVYGEHPKSGVDYVAETIKTIYDVKAKTRSGYGQIRRVNVNMAPLAIEELKELKEVGIGTFQVFQETYHKQTYARVHPANTLKGNYRWRLYAMHRAMEAGVDDVGLGALFGLYDWKFELMSLLYHSRELEAKFGVGPHTISFPRLEHADNTPFTDSSKYLVNDADFERIVTIIRLSVPHTGMIITARENADIRRRFIKLGFTQTDASTQIGIGGYSELKDKQVGKRQQFILGDTRSLDEVIREFADMGFITSFCTSGYRCGRTGACIMDMLKSGHEGQFCKINAIITFREWLDDFASEETKLAGERIIQKEIEEVRKKLPKLYEHFIDKYDKTVDGQRDIYF